VASALASPRPLSPSRERARNLLEESRRRPPRQRVFAVERRRLLRLLATEAEAPIVVVSAAAGYGKSILAAQWSGQCGRPCALLTLDSSDNDPIVLVNYLVQAVERLAPIARDLHAEVASAAPRVDEVVLPALARELTRLSPVELVLDNVQAISEPSSLAVLAFLIEHMPSGSQLVLLSRGELDLPLASRRVAGELLEIRADRLAFDVDEIRALAVRRGTVMSESSLKVVHERTEGWAAGVELALRAMSDAPPGAGVAVALGTQREVADYLLETVFERQSEQHRAFLLATSVLRRMSAPMCDAVLGTNGSVNMLRELERSIDSFVIPLDDHRGWYRYHRQFGEVLRSELDRRHPGLAAVYVTRAAEWHERHGSDPEEAFRCAHESGDVARSGRIALASFGGSMGGGGNETFRSCLQQFTSLEIASDAQLAIAAAWLYSSLGDGVTAQRYAVAAERGELDRPSADGASSIRSSLANLRSVLAYRGIHQMLTDAEYVYAAERETSARWPAESCQAIGIADLLLGRPDEAIVAFREALMATTSPDLAATRALCLGYLTFAAAETGRWPEARKWAREAKALIGERDLGHELPALVAHTAKAKVLVHDGDLYRATQELAEARGLDHLLGGMRWMTADMELRWGNLSLHLGDRLSAREHAGSACAVLHGYDDPGNLQSRLVALEERIARAGDLQLTPAELRVLPFLPTHLLVKEIAARLHLSTATVKSHLHGIFNKLDVSTRSEAVDRMEQLGLEAARALPTAVR
jgi:LuxR family transcriptional regulator, maltose regulon positive regulatory protein